MSTLALSLNVFGVASRHASLLRFDLTKVGEEDARVKSDSNDPLAHEEKLKSDSAENARVLRAPVHTRIGMRGVDHPWRSLAFKLVHWSANWHDLTAKTGDR